LELELLVNGKQRQKDFTAEMHFKINNLVSYISSFMSINEGDLLLTGTPMGVGPVNQGDRVEAFVRFNDKTLASLDFTVEKEV
jgi:acylpyruvate hydrolase